MRNNVLHNDLRRGTVNYTSKTLLYNGNKHCKTPQGHCWIILLSIHVRPRISQLSTAVLQHVQASITPMQIHFGISCLERCTWVIFAATSTLWRSDGRSGWWGNFHPFGLVVLSWFPRLQFCLVGFVSLFDLKTEWKRRISFCTHWSTAYVSKKLFQVSSVRQELMQCLGVLNCDVSNQLLLKKISKHLHCAKKLSCRMSIFM